MPQSSRLIWLDSLRLLAGVSMVALHATADPHGQAWTDASVSERVVPVVIRTLVYVARTELFLIISLFLLLMALDRRPRTYRETMAEQCRRLLVPFAFWTLFFASFNFVKAHAFGYAPALANDMTSFEAVLGWFLLGDVKYHMHFLPTLFGLVLVYPLFRAAIDRPWLGASVLIALLVKRDLDATIFSHLWGQDVLPWAIRGAKLLTYASYGMVAGAAFGLWKRTKPEDREALLPIVLWGALCLGIFKAIAAIMTIKSGAWPFAYTPGYYADFLFPVLLFWAAMMLANRSWPPLLSTWAPYSFGIYLCHPIFLDLMEIALRHTTWSPGVQVLSKIVVAIVATSAFVWLLSLCRPLAWTVGLGSLPRWSPARPQEP